MEGVLEMEKNKGLKKKWKSYGFKVSASTYLLCFKTDVSSDTHTPHTSHITHHTHTHTHTHQLVFGSSTLLVLFCLF